MELHSNSVTAAYQIDREWSDACCFRRTMASLHPQGSVNG